MSEQNNILRYINLSDSHLKSKSHRTSYNDLKTYKNQIYTGMEIGKSHYWNYNNGKWYEVKNAPDKWKFTFNCVKKRYHSAPRNTGASIQTKYHWYLLGDQIATKLDANSYLTTFKGIKYKIGHKRPYWKKFSYEYPEQLSYKDKLIQILEDILYQLKRE
ncbi:MAG: hypothetical protein GF317_17195 [Candidatus Lokiarchaeota archaeon]|nr:hypothetical protein [Candidatus Lokiarchaeota archaeon]MBD3201249.1 hypothetical protein [Candidatus Lokiarchaeota archaeon]